MAEVLQVLISFPTIAHSALVILCLVYWLFVILGAIDLDAPTDLDPSGAIKGAVGGHEIGGHEGLLEAKTGATHGIPDAAAATLVGLDSLRKIPLTISLSLFSLFGMVLSGLFCLSYDASGWLLGAGVFLGSSVVSLLLTSFVARPLAKLFTTHKAVQKSDLIGKVAQVSTGTVTETFGQAVLEDGGSSLILQVRDRTGRLSRGDKVMLVDLDEASGAYVVELVPELMAPEGRRILDDRVDSEPEAPVEKSSATRHVD
jgi:hypothetical protein